MNRRSLLRFVGVGAGVATGGCLATDGFGGGNTTAADADSPGEAGWTTFGYDRANTGHAPDVSGPTDDVSVVWTFETGSPTANTSPIVVGDTVYTGSSGTGGNLHALDAETGERRWEFETDGWVSHAPAFADGSVYVGTDGQQFVAVDAETGERRWETDLGHDLHDSSPTVADETVYVGTAGDSPAVVSDDDEVDRSGALFALDADTGDTRWAFEVSDWISTSPAVVGGRVYFGDDDGHVRALDAETGEERWSFEVNRSVFSSPTVSNEILYFGAVGTLFALDAETGDPNWTFDLDWPSVRCSPAVAEGTVYVACHGNVACPEDDTCDPPDATAKLYALDADHGAETWSYDIERDVRSSPAVADGVVYLGCASGVSAVDAESGSEAWRVEFDDYVDSSPAVADGRVFVNCSDGNVYALGE
ncbi:outer membrane protein assembly factor BamB family protein [Halorussus amylolyticus]|uniref:outer membrane protein assembly factor BamB family protein n=1 Tax=Halorussus amylolyticus TaxID=1126242 RepID=UPI00138F7ED4|nr:PQQ-binding-like beta-propeller repeat protein [Halorussus amylolyticus]